jgi:hypothetical protein
MNYYITWFLSIKSRHLFFLIVVIPFLAQIILIEVFIGTGDNISTGVLAHLRIMSVVIFASLATYLLWCWSVAMFFYANAPLHMIKHVARFKLMFVLSLFHVLLFAMSIGGGNLLNPIEPADWHTILLIGIHVMGSGALMYCLYFVARTVKTFELQKKSKFEDFSEEFFLLLFFPLGVWKIQPKINALASSAQEYKKP